jgi:hypothetical protein
LYGTNSDIIVDRLVNEAIDFHVHASPDPVKRRRFKGRGISWSRVGAQNLLKLRLPRYGRRDWKAY